MYRAIAVRMHVRLEAGGGGLDEHRAQHRRREIHVGSAVRARYPAPVRSLALRHKIRLEHRAGERRRIHFVAVEQVVILRTVSRGRGLIGP